MRRAATVFLGLGLFLLSGPPSAEPSGGSYTMRKQVIGSGEALRRSGFRMRGTVAEVGAAESSSERFRVTGGFHPLPCGLGVRDGILCDGFENAICP